MQEILLQLIEEGRVSIMDFPYLSGFRTRISELNRLIRLHPVRYTGHNKYGREYTYVKHFLYADKLGEAEKIYLGMK
jgi:hypothetical protein